MFRTKSLTGKQMKEIIQKNRPSQLSKENHNHSLRSLIADKTSRYHKHMVKLVQQVNASNSHTPIKKASNQERLFMQIQNGQLISAKVKQFITVETKFDIQNQQQSQNLQNLVAQYNCQNKQHFNKSNCFFSSAVSKKSQQKSVFKVQLEKQQLIDQNKELRRQIDNLQQRLQTAELTRIQKQSDSQSLKLTIKILQLKINEMREIIKQKQESHLKFITQPSVSIKIQSKQVRNMETQSILTEQQININLQKQLQTQKQLHSTMHQVMNFSLFLESQYNFHCDPEINVQDFFTEMRHVIIKKRKQQQDYKQKYDQLCKKHKQKVQHLSSLLNLAQGQIQHLLNKLRDSKNNSLSYFKQLLQRSRLNNMDLLQKHLQSQQN